MTRTKSSSVLWIPAEHEARLRRALQTQPAPHQLKTVSSLWWKVNTQSPRTFTMITCRTSVCCHIVVPAAFCRILTFKMWFQWIFWSIWDFFTSDGEIFLSISRAISRPYPQPSEKPLNSVQSLPGPTRGGFSQRFCHKSFLEAPQCLQEATHDLPDEKAPPDDALWFERGVDWLMIL